LRKKKTNLAPWVLCSLDYCCTCCRLTVMPQHTYVALILIGYPD